MESFKLTTICQLFIFRSYTEIPIIPTSVISNKKIVFRSSHFPIQHVALDTTETGIDIDVYPVQLEHTVTLLMLGRHVLPVQYKSPQPKQEATVALSVT